MNSKPTLVARFATRTAKIQLHHPACSVVAAYAGSPVVNATATLFPWTQADADDAQERQLKVTMCKCAK